MASPDPKYDLDYSGLENLFSDVVAYVEVRSDSVDISNDVAREMKQVGAKIAQKRDKTVTHVIFREGTLRTSNWAKKHNIPLVGIGWLASSIRRKIQFLWTPWRVDYMEELTDICGIKKKMRYKRYCKAQNVEEFKAEMVRSAEKLKKREKSYQKLKASKYDSDDMIEYENVMKLSDPFLRKKPPTPEFVKKHYNRHERLKKGGRFSWESSDDEKSTSFEDSDKDKSLDISSNKIEVDLNVGNSVDDKNQQVLHEKNDCKRAPKEPRKLFQCANDIDQPLIEPISKTNKIKVLKRLIPNAVLQSISKSSPVATKRKMKSCSIASIPEKRRKQETTVIPHTKTPINKVNVDMDQIESKETEAIPKTKVPLSPLVTNIPPTSTPQNSNFITPVMKRKSLRTKLLKNSVKKRLRTSDSSFDSPNISAEETFARKILVPDTELAVPANRYRPKQPLMSPFSIPETPLRETSENAMNTSDSEMMSLSAFGRFLDSPNVSRILDKIVPNRIPDSSNEHILYFPKDTHYQYKSAITPSFKKQIKHLTDQFPKKLAIPTIDEKRKPTAWVPEVPVITEVRRNVRRSTRLSNCDDENKLPPITTESQLQKKSSNEAVFGDVQTNKADIQARPLSQTSKSNISKSDFEENVYLNIIDLNSTETAKINREVSEIFRPDDNSSTVSPTSVSVLQGDFNNSPKLIRAKPPINKSLLQTKETESVNIGPRSLKRPWAEVNKNAERKNEIKPKKETLKTKIFRDSTDDFSLTPIQKSKTLSKKLSPVVVNEFVLVVLDAEEQKSLRASIRRLTRRYRFSASLSKACQLVVINTERPRENLDLLRALEYGNKFVSVAWIRESVTAGSWLDPLPFSVSKETVCPSTPRTGIFAEYAPMHVAASSCGAWSVAGVRAALLGAGGRLAASLRQAGVVLGARRAGAVSLATAWVLDSVREGRVLPLEAYQL